MNYYGKRTLSEIDNCIVKVCWLFDKENKSRFALAYNLLCETLAVETGWGTIKPTEKSPRNIVQMERIAFDDTKRRSLKYRELVQVELDIDIAKTTYEDLADELTALLFCRLYYKGIQKPIPASRLLRGVYWKQFYNTLAGAGNVEHYLKMCEQILDKRGAGVKSA